MSTLGLAAYKARKAEEEARREAAGQPRVRRFNLEKDGDSAIIRFAQEMDADAKNYDDKVGFGFVNLFHDARGLDKANGWKNRANCSIESQGNCFPCEKRTDTSVDWETRKELKFGQKEAFLINIVAGDPREVEVKNGQYTNKKLFTTDIDRESGDGTVYLLEQSTHNGIYDALADYFLEEEVSGGTITDKYFKITRKGSGFNDTSYGITPLKEIPAKAKKTADFAEDLYDIKEVALNEVDYAQQEAFYYRGVNTSAATETAEREPVGAGTASGAEDAW